MTDATGPGTAVPLVRMETAAGVATITLDSPHNRNALSTALIEGLLAAIAAAEADDAVRVLVLSHTGTVFCSGADLKETAAAFETGALPAARMGEVLSAIWESPKPVVARVGGAARAGGLGIIAACDLAVCAETATFAFSEVRLGVIPAVISATVSRRITARAAGELYLTGDTFDGVRAERIGLVTAAVPAEDLDRAVAGYVASLVRGAPNALAAAKQLTRRTPADSIQADLAHLTTVSVEFFTSAEGREGVTSYVEKREPRWIPRG
jgi:methylglutaconyl-CoA hydratase